MIKMPVTFKLSHLKVLRENESSPDEPYLWVVFVKIDGSTVDVGHLAAAGAAFNAPASSHGNLGSASDDMEAFDQVPIPKKLGTWETDLSLIEGLPYDLAKDSSMMAAVVVALEEDASQGDRVGEARQRFVSRVKEKVADVLGKSADVGLAAIAGAQEAAEETLYDTFFMNLSVEALSETMANADILGFITLAEVADPDDMVGVGIAGPYTYGQIREAGAEGISFRIVLGGGEEGLYRVKGKVTGSTFDFVFPVARPQILTRSVNRRQELNIFARGMDRAIYQSARRDNAWSGWGSHPGAGVLSSGPAAVSWSSTHLDVFALGGDNRIWQSHWDGSGWSGWNSPMPVGYFSSGPAAVSPHTGRVDVFARGMDLRFYHSSWQGAWSNWAAIGNGTFRYSPAATTWRRGELSVVGIGMDRRMYHSVLRKGEWTSWAPIGVGTFTSSPTIVSRRSTELDVFARGFDDRYYHATWLGSEWSGWGPVGEGTFRSGPSACVTRPRQIQLIGAGQDRDIYINTLGSGGWAGWGPIPGEGRFI